MQIQEWHRMKAKQSCHCNSTPRETAGELKLYLITLETQGRTEPYLRKIQEPQGDFMHLSDYSATITRREATRKTASTCQVLQAWIN